MGYGSYEFDDGIKRGYSVICKCHKRGCKEKINRGIAYLCYSCLWYFCPQHVTWAWDTDDESIEFDCFAGESPQCCESCAIKAEQEKRRVKVEVEG